MDSEVEVGTLSLPAGSFLVQCDVAADADGAGDDVALGCSVEEATGLETGETTFDVSIEDGLSVHDVVTLPAPGDVHLQCMSAEPHTYVSSVVMTAVAVGAVH